MPREDERMNSRGGFDALVDEVRARDETPEPSESFVRGLEGRLIAMERSTTRLGLNPRAENMKPLRGGRVGVPAL